MHEKNDVIDRVPVGIDKLAPSTFIRPCPIADDWARQANAVRADDSQQNLPLSNDRDCRAVTPSCTWYRFVFS